MAIINSVVDCLLYLEISKQAFPVLTTIIKPKDVKVWSENLASCPSLDDYLLGVSSNFNLLNVSIIAGWGLKNHWHGEPLAHYQRLLKKLNLYLQTFPTLKSNRNFRSKIKNLSGLSLLATLSELSLAYQLAISGWQVEFETKFKHAGTGTEKDVDLSATDSQGRTVHVEVYMLNEAAEIDGFFDPHQDDAKFAGKIRSKLLTKFGSEEIGELNGQVLLAVNTAFFDMLRLKSLLPHTTDDKALSRLIPQHVDGLLLFDDGFETDDSFKFSRYILRCQHF